ncbi:MAG: hypothetical protein ACLQQ4_18630 [Bacteroidia bacterium]
MKIPLLLVVLIYWACTLQPAFGQQNLPDSGVTNKTEAKNLNGDSLWEKYSKYLGKEVYNLLLSDNCKNYKDFNFIDEPPMILQGASIDLPDSTILEIHISTFNSVGKYNANRNWDRELFYKEKIGEIIITKNGKLISYIRPDNPTASAQQDLSNSQPLQLPPMDTTVTYYNKWEAVFKPRQRASAYDTIAIYFNKWKVNFNLDIGVGLDDNFLTSFQTLGLYGLLNPLYSISYSPTYNFFTSYGITEKSAFGLGLSYQQVFFNPLITSQNLSQGNVLEFAVAARYMHCMRSWRYFYYGVQLGVMFLKMDLDTSAYRDKPQSAVPLVLPVYGGIVGFRYPIDVGLWMHIEASYLVPLVGTRGGEIVNENFGLNYCIDTRTVSHKPVKTDPYEIKMAKKDYAEAHPEGSPRQIKRDSIKFMRRHYRSVYDSTSIYYNKKKLHFSLETGSTDIGSILSYSFGNLNPAYSEAVYPYLSFSADYGIREKSEIGINATYQQVYFNPTTSSLNYTTGNISLMTINARYTHCIWSWKYFYYGVQLGEYFWVPNYNQANTFSGNPLNTGPLMDLSLGAFAGVRIRVIKNLEIRSEIAITSLQSYFDYGISYSIDTKKIVSGKR